ncbi:hypothetical protein J6590_084498 [Homalodisca vitripennis]|nr:hypothetical protein J6590_084498 [Homalodisca vitripennis]
MSLNSQKTSFHNTSDREPEVLQKKDYYLADVLQYLVPILKGNSKNIGSNLPPPPEPDDQQQTLVEEEEAADNSINEVDDAPRGSAKAYHSSGRQLGKRKPTTPLDEAMSDELFLLSLKKDMKEMNSRQKRTFKRRIFSLIDEVVDDSPGHMQTHDKYSSSSLQSSRSPSVLTNNISSGNPGQENEDYVFKTLTNAFGTH